MLDCDIGGVLVESVGGVVVAKIGGVEEEVGGVLVEMIGGVLVEIGGVVVDSTGGVEVESPGGVEVAIGGTAPPVSVDWISVVVSAHESAAPLADAQASPATVKLPSITFFVTMLTL